MDDQSESASSNNKIKLVRPPYICGSKFGKGRFTQKEYDDAVGCLEKNDITTHKNVSKDMWDIVVAAVGTRCKDQIKAFVKSICTSGAANTMGI